MESKKNAKKELRNFLLSKVIIVPKGSKLYHGTMHLFPTNYPTNKANWFAIDPEQSALHVIKKMGFSSDIYGLSTNDIDFLFENKSVETVNEIHPRMYVYETKKDIFLFNLGDSNEMEEFVLKIGFKTFSKDQDFSEHNKSIASHLCDLVGDNEHVIGWYRMKDQKEVVICHETQKFLNHVDTINMNTSVLNFDWKQVQNYVKQYKKYENILNTNTTKIDNFILESIVEFSKFIGKKINDLFDDSIYESNIINYTNKDLEKLWVSINHHFSQKSKRHKPNDINKLISNLEVYFGDEMFEYLGERYQISLERLSKINNSIHKLKLEISDAKNEYTVTNEEDDEVINKAVPYILKHIQPIVNKIYFCLLQKNNVCRNKQNIGSDVGGSDVLCSYWTSDDKKLLLNVSKAFNYKYNHIKNDLC